MALAPPRRRGQGRNRTRVTAPGRSREKDTLDHYLRFAETLTIVDRAGDVVPLQVEDWQRAIVEDYFAGYTETLAEVPSGSGKTTIFSTVALHHGTYVRRDCRALILSSSGKQARQMYEAAAGFVSRSKGLSAWWVPQEYGLGRLKSLTDRGRIEIVSPSPTVTEGEIPSLVLGDEIHRHADDGRAYSILLSKLQKLDARVLACTTAGDDEESYLGRKRLIALQGEGMFVEGHLVPELRDKPKVKATYGRDVVRPGESYTVARDSERDISYHEWSLPLGGDPENFQDVKAANPASFVTIESLRKTHKLLQARKWDWLRQHCNRWALGEHSAINPEFWADCANSAAGALAGRPFWVGLDMGGVSDSTAIVPVWRDADDPGTGAPRFVTAGGLIVWPPGEGEWTLVEDIREVLREAIALPGDFQGIVFDRAKGGGYVAQDIEKSMPGVTIIDHGQTAEMDDASELLARLVAEKSLTHDGDEQITRQVLAAAVHRSRRNRWYLAKPPSQPHRKIDAAVALAMALRVANSPIASSVYEDRDLLIFE